MGLWSQRSMVHRATANRALFTNVLLAIPSRTPGVIKPIQEQPDRGIASFCRSPGTSAAVYGLFRSQPSAAVVPAAA